MLCHVLLSLSSQDPYGSARFVEDLGDHLYVGSLPKFRFKKMLTVDNSNLFMYREPTCNSAGLFAQLGRRLDPNTWARMSTVS